MASYFWVGSISYNSWMPNKLGCRIMVIRSTPSVFLWFCRYYHYTRFGEVLLFLTLKTVGRHTLRIMKLTRFVKLFFKGFFDYSLFKYLFILKLPIKLCFFIISEKIRNS